MKYKVHSITSKSKYHTYNEDKLHVSDNCIVIADGMGGECDGDIASRLAVETVVENLPESINTLDEAEIKTLLDNAIECADSKIVDYIDNNPDSFGMGTTILIAVRQNDNFFISWCGDSHCYLYSEGQLKSLTKDHSYVQELIDAGEITVKESFTHPENNLITRYVGGGKETCNPDFRSCHLNDSDIMIMCSDGLSGYCHPTDIADIISSIKNISKLPHKLQDLAIRHGSDDDITIVVISPAGYSPAHSGESVLDWFKKIGL